jgi:hypothetical protein
MPQLVRTPFGTLHGSTITEAASGAEVKVGMSQTGSASMAAMLALRKPAGTFNGVFESAGALDDSLAQGREEVGRLAMSAGSGARIATLDDCGNPMAQEKSDRTRDAAPIRRLR